MRKRGILLALLCAALPGTIWAQNIADVTMTLIDHDGNGYANIGDEVEVSVVVDGVVPGTSARMFDNDLFEGAGPFHLDKITPGFGDGIEYARTLTIAPGATHDGQDPGAVEFIAQVRVDGSTVDDKTDLTIDGVTELIDNVPPSVGNAVFDGATGLLITGDDFEVSVDASDGGGPIEVTADLSRLGLDDLVTIPFDAGDTWLLDTEQIQEALTSDQVSLSQERSVVFTVTDAAGNVTVHDSASDSQVRTIDNVSPAAPEFLAVQRATDFNNALDLMDLVVTDGPAPVDQSEDPLVDESGEPITYADLMADGVFNVYWSVGGQPFELLTSLNYDDSGHLVQQDLPFAEFAEGDTLEFQVEAVKSSSLAGETASDSLEIQRGVVEAIILDPEEGQVIGNGPEFKLSSVIVQPVGTLADYAVEQMFRLYFRDVDMPSELAHMDLLAAPDGTFIESFTVEANDFSGAGFGLEVDLAARPNFRVNGVNLRNLHPSVAFQNNPIVRIEIDWFLESDQVFEDRFEVQQP